MIVVIRQEGYHELLVNLITRAADLPESILAINIKHRN